MANPINDDLQFSAPRADGTPRPDARSSDASVEQLSETVDQVRTHLNRAKRRLERTEQQCDSLMRYVQALSLLLVIVVVGFGGLAWYGISIVNGQRPIVIESVNPKPAEVANPAEVVPTPPPPPATVAGEPPEVPAERPDNVARQRVDFHVESNQTVQVASGIYLTIKNTDIAQRTADGWLQIARDGSIVKIQGQETGKPLRFRSKSDDHAGYLYFERVDPRRVDGYLLLPLPKGEVAAHF